MTRCWTLFCAGWMAFLCASGCQVREASIACAPDNDGLVLPEGFCAVVVADTLGRARHLTVRGNGDIYVALRTPHADGGIAALRDTTGDGTADSVAYFGEHGGGGIHLRGAYLYFASDTMIVRYPMDADALLPAGEAETVVSGLARGRSHALKPFEFDDAGNMYVNVGAPSNTCQDPPRTPGVAGQDPCPLLERFGGVWRFDADRLGQTQQKDGYRFASGIRNGVANAWNPLVGKLFVVQHGRDDLHRFWPERFTEEDNNQLPAEEFFVVENGSDFGWPYCYFDHFKDAKLLNPEYGGDGNIVGRCEEFDRPIYGFPGHWAPNDVLFYTGGHFPARYHGGALVAFHGSWNREPVQQGYRIVFLPMDGETPTGDFETFAAGFVGTDTLTVPTLARARPTGLAMGPEGSLYIADSRHGRIWRIVHQDGQF